MTSPTENILALIPGDYISAALRTLPDAATAPDEPPEGVYRLTRVLRRISLHD